MSTLPCAHSLCAADHHDATPEPIRHHRVTSEEGERCRVVASWTDEDPATAYVELTHADATLTLTPHDAAVWADVLVSGTASGHTFDLAIGLGVAVEALALVDENGELPRFGSRFLTMSVNREITSILDGAEATR